MNEMILIGGPWDGKRISAEIAAGSPILTVAVQRPEYRSFEAFIDESPFDYSESLTRYDRMTFADREKRFDVWVHQDEDSPMESLLKGYRVPPITSDGRVLEG